jgi:acyl-CoA synthetase (AMP-forming)/AMP-acid ligase II
MTDLSALVDRYADRWPEKEVIVYGEQRLTNRVLAQRVNALAAAFRAAGVGSGDVVALLMYNRPEFLETAFAVNKIGAAFLPLNYRLAAPEWQYIVDHSGAVGIVAESEFAAQIEDIAAGLPALRHRILVGEGRTRWTDYEQLVAAHAGEVVPDAGTAPEELQRLMYTSGTTSRPKGVCISHGNVIWKNIGHIVEFGIDSDDRTLVAGPLYHVGALDLPASGVLYAGGSVVILRKFDARELLETTERERPTNMWLAPTMVNMVLQIPDLQSWDLSSVRFIINGGEKMPAPLVERLMRAFPNARLADAYGLTETVSGDTFLDAEHVVTKIGSVGKPVVHLELRIVDDEGKDVPSGQLGEIALRGPKVFKAYWRDDEATALAIRDGWFHTGDMGRVDADGYLYIEDRKKDMIVSGGENISSSEVERALYEHPAVLEVAVVGVPDERWGEVPKAFVVLRDGAIASADDLIAHCRGRLAKFKVPKHVEFLDSLPRNPSGKILKRELRKLEAPGEAPVVSR